MSIYEVMDLDKNGQWIKITPDLNLNAEDLDLDAIDAVNMYFNKYINTCKTIDDRHNFNFLVRRTEPGERKDDFVIIFANATIDASVQNKDTSIIVVTRGLDCDKKIEDGIKQEEPEWTTSSSGIPAAGW